MTRFIYFKLLKFCLGTYVRKLKYNIKNDVNGCCPMISKNGNSWHLQLIAFFPSCESRSRQGTTYSKTTLQEIKGIKMLNDNLNNQAVGVQTRIRV